MQQGTIKFFNVEKDYGFVTDAETRQDIFGHATGLNGSTVQQHDRVGVETREGQKGPSAVSVRKL